jgi:mono/diheme cytochrome c family protein
MQKLSFLTATGCLAVMLCTLLCFNSCAEDYTDGRQAYDQLCSSCHGSMGQGLNALIPPLAGSDWLTNPDLREQIPCAIRKGMQGKILVNGKPYEGVMQAFPKLSDVDINNIMNYIGMSWGNQAEPFLVPDTRKQLKGCE